MTTEHPAGRLVWIDDADASQIERDIRRSSAIRARRFQSAVDAAPADPAEEAFQAAFKHLNLPMAGAVTDAVLAALGVSSEASS